MLVLFASADMVPTGEFGANHAPPLAKHKQPSAKFTTFLPLNAAWPTMQNQLRTHTYVPILSENYLPELRERNLVQTPALLSSLGRLES